MTTTVIERLRRARGNCGLLGNYAVFSKQMHMVLVISDSSSSQISFHSLVEYSASARTFQRTRFVAMVFTSLHTFPHFSISSFIVLLHVLLGRPTSRAPCGFHSSACFSIASAGFRRVSPIQLHFLLLIWIAIGSSSVNLHSFWFHFISICLSDCSRQS